MILRYGVKHGYVQYREIDVKFPTERERREVEVLTRNDQKKKCVEQMFKSLE